MSGEGGILSPLLATTFGGRREEGSKDTDSFSLFRGCCATEAGRITRFTLHNIGSFTSLRMLLWVEGRMIP